MSGEQLGEAEHQGEKYLRLLGLEDYADHTIQKSDGTSIQARDFLEVCGEHALPILVGFEAMSPDDPQYEGMKDSLRGFISQYIEGEN